jgi:hypothetical protein
MEMERKGSNLMDSTSAKPADLTWGSLFRIGGIAPLVTFALYLSQVLIIIISGEAYPTTPESWFVLIQRSKLLGLIFLNALDGFSIAVLGLMFLALFIALRKTNPSYMAAAAFFAFLGVAIFVSMRAFMVSGALNLSDQYAAAGTAAQKSQILTAWRAITSPARATPETIGFLFMAVSGFITSMVMLRSKTFSRVTACIGIVAGVATLANDICLVVAPSVAALIMPVNGLLWLIWWILTGQKLLQLGRSIK